MHKRVTCGRIFYQGAEHSAVYYNGEEQFEFGELHDEDEPPRIYINAKTGAGDGTYSELRDTYSNADYPLKEFTNLSQGAYRWRVDWDYIEFEYSGACQIGIRGDGIVKFNDGSSCLVKTRVSHEADADYARMDRTTILCPASATKGIFVGTLSPLGFVRYETKYNDKETADAFNKGGCVLYFGWPGILKVDVGYEEAQGDQPYGPGAYSKSTRRQTRMTFARRWVVNNGARNLITTYYGKNYYKKCTSVSTRNYRYGNNDMRDIVASMLNLRDAFAYSYITEIPIRLLRKLGNLRDADAEGEKQWNEKYGKKQGYRFSFTSHCTGTMAGAFANCKRLESIHKDVFAALKPCDCAGAFENDTGLTSLPDGLFDWFYNQLTLGPKYGRNEGAGLCWNNPHAQLRNAFKGCKNLTGSTPTITMADGQKKKIWEIIGIGDMPGYSLAKWETNRWKKPNGETAVMPVSCEWCNGCFEGCTNLDDYDEIPDSWKLPVGKAVLRTPIVSDYTGETITVFDVESGDTASDAEWY